jgi:hypothetical protein
MASARERTASLPTWAGRGTLAAMRLRNVRGGVALVLATASALAAGCGDDDDESQSRRVSGTPDPAHIKEVARNPYAITCRDIARQPLHPESQKLVIRAEFALAQVPALREVVAKETLNRTGRSVYFGLTEECKGRDPSFKPARPAIAGVLAGKYRAGRGRPG